MKLNVVFMLISLKMNLFIFAYIKQSCENEQRDYKPTQLSSKYVAKLQN